MDNTSVHLNVINVVLLQLYRHYWSKLSYLSSVCLPAVFGKSLKDTITYDQRFGPHLVPILVQKCVEFIKEQGLDEEGIFRLPGQDNAVKQFRDACDAGERPSFPR